MINAADSYPLIVPRIRHYLTDGPKLSDEQRLAWIQHWLGAGLEAIEALLAQHPASGRFCLGDGPPVADTCLVTQVTPAKTFNCALDPYRRVMRYRRSLSRLPPPADKPPPQRTIAQRFSALARFRSSGGRRDFPVPEVRLTSRWNVATAAHDPKLSSAPRSAEFRDGVAAPQAAMMTSRESTNAWNTILSPAEASMLADSLYEEA